VGYHQLSRGSSTYTTRPAGYPSGGVPPAVERQLYLHHTPSRVPQRYHQLSRGRSTYLLTRTCATVRWITFSAQRSPERMGCRGTPSLSRRRTTPVHSPASTTAHALPEPAPLT
jgi:hypothetical protein